MNTIKENWRKFEQQRSEEKVIEHAVEVFEKCLEIDKKISELKKQ